MPDLTDFAADQFHRLPDGKRLRYAVFEPERAPRATLLVAPGRREFIEKKFAELGPSFLRRGFRIVIFEWRGQGLSDRWLDGERRQRDHALDFTTHLRDLDSFYAAVLRPRQVGPLLLTGHSLGAHLILRWLAENPGGDVAGVIITAPMLALASLPAQTIAQGVSWVEVKLGNGEDYATGHHDYNDRDRQFAHNPLTHDATRFALLDEYFTAHPSMKVGGVTWDWMNAACKSLHLIQRRSYLQRITTPILSLTGSKDRITPPDELSHYLGYLPKVENVILKGALHDVMSETDAFRHEAWRHIDGFLEKTVLYYLRPH